MWFLEAATDVKIDSIDNIEGIVNFFDHRQFLDDNRNRYATVSGTAADTVL
jgi:hypothetical protein